MGDNASWFERQMEMMKIDCPQGTIANAFRNNPYMKLHVDKWEKNGAKGRVLVLMRELQKQVGMLQTEDVTDMATT